MTDERIKEEDERVKEEFEKNANVDADYKCLQFALNYASAGELKVVSAGSFYAGFRAAERLAKIEVLNELRDKSEYKMNPEMYRFFTRKIEELREASR